MVVLKTLADGTTPDWEATVSAMLASTRRVGEVLVDPGFGQASCFQKAQLWAIISARVGVRRGSDLRTLCG
jgi:hypothetical protein